MAILSATEPGWGWQWASRTVGPGDKAQLQVWHRGPGRLRRRPHFLQEDLLGGRSGHHAEMPICHPSRRGCRLRSPLQDTVGTRCDGRGSARSHMKVEGLRGQPQAAGHPQSSILNCPSARDSSQSQDNSALGTLARHLLGLPTARCCSWLYKPLQLWGRKFPHVGSSLGTSSCSLDLGCHLLPHRYYPGLRAIPSLAHFAGLQALESVQSGHLLHSGQCPAPFVSGKPGFWPLQVSMHQVTAAVPLSPDDYALSQSLPTRHHSIQRGETSARSGS